MEFNVLIQGTKVEFDYQKIKGTGVIVGIALRDAFSTTYIIEPDKSIASDIYPYTHFVCPSGHLKVIDRIVDKHEDRKDSPHHYSNRLD